MQRLIFILLLSTTLIQAHSYINWQPPQAKAKKGAPQAHGGHSRGKAKQFAVNNCDHSADTEAYYLMPTLEKKEITPHHGMATLPRTGMGNYHALVINQTKGNTLNSSVRYIYAHGRPSKTSPHKITAFEKSDLEIAPNPLPREHDRYAGSRTYEFQVRFKGEEFANATVILNTSNGTRETLITDDKGGFKITFPNDFKDVKDGRRKNKPAEFTLSAMHVDGEKIYTTTLAMPYSVNPIDYWQSQWSGLIVAILGLILGMYFVRAIIKMKKGKA